MTSFTPDASTPGSLLIHEFAIDGAASQASIITNTLEILPGITETRTHSVLHNSPDVDIFRYRHEYTQDSTSVDRLVFTIAGLHRTVLITQDGPVLLVDINQLRFRVTPASARQIIEIQTQDGHDTVYVAATLAQPVHINTGSGDDTVITGAGAAEVLTGPGNDRVMTHDGATYIETGDGDDVVNAYGSGAMIAYTGKGNDFARAGAGECYIETGEGNDIAMGGQRHSVISGGDGEDLLIAGPGSNTLYSGLGEDAVLGIKANDHAYSQDPATVISNGTLLTEHTMRDAASFIDSHISRFDARPLADTGIIVHGREEFVERVQDDLKLLLSSTQGQQLLAVLSQSVRERQPPILIVELKYLSNGIYVPAHADGRAYIQANSTGIPSFGGTVYYNPAHAKERSVPLASLYHELCHAYNHMTGTLFLGSSPDQPQDGITPPIISNIELQAVGLPSNVEPFDFDNDPATPPTRTNPVAFTENGLLAEMGIPLRSTYARYIRL